MLLKAGGPVIMTYERHCFIHKLWQRLLCTFQAGVDTEALIIGYVEMLDKLNAWLKAVLHQYNQVFIRFVTFILVF